MKKVLIIGGNGSGKSTFSKRLAKITNLPLCHLDSLYWTDGWTPRDKGEFISLLTAELEKPSWILDGNMKSTLETRLSYCDTVIYLDFSTMACVLGVIKRVIKNYGKSRDDMAKNCPEKFDNRTFTFLKSVLKFNKNNRANFYTAIASAPNVKLIVLKNRRQVNRYLKKLSNEINSRNVT